MEDLGLVKMAVACNVVPSRLRKGLPTFLVIPLPPLARQRLWNVSTPLLYYMASSVTIQQCSFANSFSHQEIKRTDFEVCNKNYLQWTHCGIRKCEISLHNSAILVLLQLGSMMVTYLVVLLQFGMSGTSGLKDATNATTKSPSWRRTQRLAHIADLCSVYKGDWKNCVAFKEAISC
jgi:hypothetical protein